MRRPPIKMLALLAAVALATAACAPKNFSMEGKDAEQMSKDESQCRAQVRAQAQRERNIEDSRRSTFDGERERYGQQDLYRTMRTVRMVGRPKRLRRSEPSGSTTLPWAPIQVAWRYPEEKCHSPVTR